MKIIDEVPVRFSDVCVHEFTMSDVDDIEIYVASPIWDWQQSEEGCWVMEHAVNEPYWVQNIDSNSLSYRIRIMARLSEKDQIFWKLKWAGRKK